MTDNGWSRREWLGGAAGIGVPAMLAASGAALGATAGGPSARPLKFADARAERRDLENRRLKSVPALFSSTYMAPWLGWMGMQGQPGHTIWHADGIKLASVEELPEAYLERIRRLHPGQLEVSLS